MFAGGMDQNTMLYTGGAVAALLLLGAIAIFAGGGSRQRPRERAPLSGAERARQLKQEGLAEMRQGQSYLSKAGMPGTPGEQDNLALARDHLGKAQQCFSTALEYVPTDMDLEDLATSCGRMLYTAQKRSVVNAAY
jgi:hypothetical protein